MSGPGQLLRYAALGAVGTACHYMVLVALVELAEVGRLLATTLGFATGAVVNYLLNYHLLFTTGLAHGPTFARFLTVAVFGAGVNAAVFGALLGLGLHYLVAQLVATAAVVVLTFVANKRWTFRD